MGIGVFSFLIEPVLARIEPYFFFIEPVFAGIESSSFLLNQF
jgi:hypothetical protein